MESTIDRFRFELSRCHPGEIAAGKRAFSVDTGLRLSAFFGMSDGFWIGLQTDDDTARRNAGAHLALCASADMKVFLQKSLAFGFLNTYSRCATV